MRLASEEKQHDHVALFWATAVKWRKITSVLKYFSLLTVLKSTSVTQSQVNSVEGPLGCSTRATILIKKRKKKEIRKDCLQSVLLLCNQQQGVKVPASYLEAEIIISCDLLGICQLNEIITQSCSCTLPWSHRFSRQVSSCFDSRGIVLVPVSFLCSDREAQGKH